MADVGRFRRGPSRSLGIYRTVWAWLVTILGTVGVLTAYSLRPTDQFVAVGVTGLSLGACAGCLFDLRDETVTIRSMVVFGLAGSAWLLALLGLGVLFGAPAVLAGVLLVVLSPWTLSTTHRLLSRKSRPAEQDGQPLATPVPDLPARKLDDKQLINAWRASSAALSGVGTDDDRWLAIAKRRQEYLNELERRDPRGFNAWLSSKPDLDADPSDFLFQPNKTDSGAGDQ